jgi:PAS domain S-box-containing protein
MRIEEPAHGEPAFDGSDMGAVFGKSGELGRDLLKVDWESTPLGSLSSWSQSLKAVVRVMLTSRFSMWMAWGPELTFLSNDTYRQDTLGSKYPWALGRSAREVWAEIWPDIGPRIEAVMTTGVASWEESLLLFLERSGFREETYHTFSYSPLTDDDGQIAGMLCVVSEVTDRVIGERRMGTLQALGSELTSALTEQEVSATVQAQLGANLLTLPFSLIYLFEGDGVDARLTCAAGARPGDPVAPEFLDGLDSIPAWPIAELAQGRTVVVESLGDHFAAVPMGGWEEPAARALVVPLKAPTNERPYGFLVAGLNPFRPLDASYEGFISLVANSIAASIANARAYDAERQRAETLAELDRAKTAFFTNVSHELRTPLTLLLAPAEDSLRDTTSVLAPDQRARIELVHTNGQRLLKLVNTLLDFSRLESGRVVARFEPVDLARYTTQLTGPFRVAVERAGLILEVECEALGEPVFVDLEMWAKIVSNLLSNALKFTFEGGIAVRLSRVSQPAPGVLLEVDDSGIGIEPVDQARLFERFHRVEEVRSRTYEGSGIGLALVAELAEMHGGEVAARSAPGSGSTISVRLPLGSAHLPPDQVFTEHAGDQRSAEEVTAGFVEEALRWLDTAASSGVGLGDIDSASRTDGDQPRVLVVDDNADMRRYISSLLADTYLIDVAPDGAVALEMATVHLPDLVLTDVMMPNLDGYGLLKALRGDPRTAHVPVIMLSARSGEEAAIEGLDAGADDYLVKPFSALELVARVRSNLELERTRREAGRDRQLLAEIRLSQERLDQAQRLAGLGSWEIDLTTGQMSGSGQFLRMLGATMEELADLRPQELLTRFLHPDDRGPFSEALAAGRQGAPVGIECRLIREDGTVALCDLHGEIVHDPTSGASYLRGSVQDITEQRATERALALAELAQETARHEHRIAEDLQRSLVPAPTLGSDHLEIATYYQPGEQGTQVGGDWYDVIKLGAGRTALVIGDVMGRGVRAAAVMGQLRAAVRAYARLDLPPSDVMEFLDGTVRDLDGSQLVTCIYGIYDPAEPTFVYSNAGHLPPLLSGMPGGTRRLTGGLGPPLGVDRARFLEDRVDLAKGATLVLYTDGLVERRDRDLDTGIDAVVAHLEANAGSVTELTSTLVEAMVPDGAGDDIAILAARLPEDSRPWASATYQLPTEQEAVATSRRLVAATLRRWEIPPGVTDDVVLLTSELVTNAIIHGRPPIELRLRRMAADLLLEVIDTATLLPRKQQPTPDDEHGRGLQIVELLADRWGTRATERGKSMWCMTTIKDDQPAGEGLSPG